MTDPNRNAMLVIVPRKIGGVWCFDDERHGLVQEPFILGASEMIDAVVTRLGLRNAENGFRLFFSASPFPDYHAELHRLQEENGGYWYQFADGSMKGWLCPATLNYFPQHPERLYVRGGSLDETMNPTKAMIEEATRGGEKGWAATLAQTPEQRRESALRNFRDLQRMDLTANREGSNACDENRQPPNPANAEASAGMAPEEYSRLLNAHGVAASQSWDEHKNALFAAARATGTYIHDSTPFAPGPDLGGAEHHVHLDESSGRFNKLSKHHGPRSPFGSHLTAHHYLEKLANLSKLSPLLDIRVHGIAQDRAGMPQIVTSARKIEGVHPTAAELEAHLRSQGWVPWRRISYLGSDGSQKGVGKNLMRQALMAAEKEQAGVILTSLEEAKPFFHRMGLLPVAGCTNDFEADPARVSRILDSTGRDEPGRKYEVGSYQKVGHDMIDERLLKDLDDLEPAHGGLCCLPEDLDENGSLKPEGATHQETEGRASRASGPSNHERG